MNFEETQRVKGRKTAEAKKAEEAAQAKASEKKREALEFLETRRMFKDLLDGREETFKLCKEYLLLNVLLPQVGMNDLTDAKFAAGYRLALETFEQVIATYKAYEKEYVELTK